MAFGSSDLTLIIKAKDQASMILEKIRGNVSKNAAMYEKAGRRMLIASAALTAGLGIAINQAAKFQQSMAQVSTMLDEAGMKHMPRFEKAIKRMSMEFGEGTDTLADGLYSILSASIPAEKAISVLDASVRAAKAGLTNTGIAADAITTIINSYGLSADRAADVSDLLFAIVKRGKLTFAELAPNIGKVAAMAANAGMSMEDLGATIATMTRAGIRTEIAMTAVKGILNSMMGATEAAATAFEDKLGIAMNTTTLRAEGIVGILTRMKEAGLKPEEIKKMFPNVRALIGVVATMGDLEGVTYDYNLMVNRAGLSQEAFEKNINTSAVAMLKIKTSMNIIAVGIGTQLLPIVNALSSAIVKLAKWFDSLDNTYKTMIAVTIALSAAFLALAGISLLILTRLPLMLKGFVIVTTAMAKSTVATLALSSAMRFGLGAAIVATTYKLTQLILMVPVFIRAMNEQKEAVLAASEKQQEAFTRSMKKVSELREEYNKLGWEYKHQIILLDEIRLQMEDKDSTTKEGQEAILALQRRYMEEFQELLAMKREADIEDILRDEGKKERAQEHIGFLESLTDKEKVLYQNLSDELRKLSLSEIKDKNRKLMEERKDREFAIRAEIKDKTKLREYLKKLNKIYAKEDVALAKATAREKSIAALNVADISVQALMLALDAEGSSAKKKKKIMIGLLMLEKSLAIAKLWTAEITWKGVAGIATAMAGTALIVAQFAVLMKGMRGAGVDISRIEPIPVFPAGDTSKISEPEIGDAEEDGVITTVSGGRRATVVGTGAVSRVTRIDVGGVEVNLGGIDVREENLEEILRDIGEAVKSKTVEAVTMAMRIYNTGKELEEEAV